MIARTVAVALWHYRDTTDRVRRAHYGQVVDLADVQPADTERAERLGVFRGNPQKSNADTPALEKPAVRAPKDEWVEYAVSRGVNQGEAEAMSKAELIAATDLP